MFDVKTGFFNRYSLSIIDLAFKRTTGSSQGVSAVVWWYGSKVQEAPDVVLQRVFGQWKWALGI